MRAGQQPCHTEQASKTDTRGWPRNGHKKLRAGALGFASDLRDSSQNKQGDGTNLQAIDSGNQTVGDLMKDDRGKEQGAGHDANNPVPETSPMRILAGKLRGKREGHQTENDERRSVDLELDPPEAKQSDLWSRHARITIHFAQRT